MKEGENQSRTEIKYTKRTALKYKEFKARQRGKRERKEQLKKRKSKEEQKSREEENE